MLLEEKAEKEEKKKAQPKPVDKRIDVFEETKSLRVSFWIGVGILSLTAFLSIIMLIYPQAFFANFNAYSGAIVVAFRLIAVVMLLLSVVFGCVALSQYKKYKHLAGNFSVFYLTTLIIGAVIIIFNYFFVDSSKIGFLQSELSQGYAFVFIWLPLMGFVTNIVCNFCSRLIRVNGSRGQGFLYKVVLSNIFLTVLAILISVPILHGPIMQTTVLDETYYIYAIGDVENEDAYIQIDNGEIHLNKNINKNPVMLWAIEYAENKNFPIGVWVVVGMFMQVVFILVPILMPFFCLFVWGNMCVGDLKLLIKAKGIKVGKLDLLICFDSYDKRKNSVKPELELVPVALIINIIIMLINSSTQMLISVPMFTWNYILWGCITYRLIMYAFNKVTRKKIEKEKKERKELNALFN